MRRSVLPTSSRLALAAAAALLVPGAALPNTAASSAAEVERVSAQRAAADEVRIATYNIAFGRMGLDAVANDIARLKADVVLLQEVDDRRSSGGRNQAAYLAGQLGMDWRYDPNSTKAFGKRGNAVLSRTPLADRTRYDLPNVSGQEPRGLMRVSVAPNGVPMHVWVTHLNPGPGKQRQAERVRDLVGRPTCATVVGGDLNTTPDTSEYRAATANLVDLFARKGQGRGGTTANGRARIDYLLVKKATPVIAKVAPLRNSDHRAVQGKVQVTADRGC